MDAYTTAWLIIIVAAAGGSGILYWMLRKLANSMIRNLIVVLCVAFFVVPAPVPQYPEIVAPAFVVFIFEALFQTDGAPLTSGRILLSALGLAALLVVAAHVAHKRFGRQGA